jgi:hypothetical protein
MCKKLKRNKIVSLILLISLGSIMFCFQACNEIIETNLEKKHIVLVSPADGTLSVISLQTFWWDELKGADKYNLQIVQPSFANAQQLILDTNVSNNKFEWSLLPGSYQWRVKAFNNSSSTEYVTFSLRIDSTPDISHQIIRLIAPLNLDTTNLQSFVFSWENLYNAEDYRFEIWQPDFTTGTNILSVVVNNCSYTYEIPTEGSFEWGVRGQNSTTNTLYSKRTLYIDKTAPNIPVLLTPHNRDSVNNTYFDFTWSRGTTSGSSIKDSLFIYSDSLMNSPKRLKYLSSAIWSDSLGTGKYFWRVKSFDAAGNSSEYSTLWKVVVK